jgi:hypothetical protein
VSSIETASDRSIEPNTPAIVEQLDGEPALIIVLDVLEETISEFELPMGGSPTLYAYWGHRLDPDEVVVEAQHARVTDEGEYITTGGTYAYPISQVQPVGGESA